MVESGQLHKLWWPEKGEEAQRPKLVSGSHRVHVTGVNQFLMEGVLHLGNRFQYVAVEGTDPDLLFVAFNNALESAFADSLVEPEAR